MGLFDSHKDRKQRKAQEAAAEENRHQKLLAGELMPITVSTDLQLGETAYLQLTARRMASVESTVLETVGTSKKKHVVRRAVVGTVLLGPVGTIAGAASAGGKQTSITTQKTVSNTELIDSGDLVLTNKRFVFTGNNGVTSIPYSDITATSLSSNRFSVKYPGMLKDEYYEIFGPAAGDIQLYLNNLVKKQ